MGAKIFSLLEELFNKYKLMKKRYYILTACIAVIGIVAVAGYLQFNNINVINKVVGSADIQNEAAKQILGVRSQETGATTVTKLTASFTGGGSASSTWSTRDVGQMDVACSYTPYETGTELQARLYNGILYRSTKNCKDANVTWYPIMNQTIQAATTTYQAPIQRWAQAEGIDFVASTTYAFYLPRDWSSECGKIQFKEVGVTSALGDIFCEYAPSN